MSKRQTSSKPAITRPVFLIVSEGRETEKRYFEGLEKFSEYAVDVRCVKKGDRSAPQKCIKAMEGVITDLKEDHDQAWFVVDVDHWKEQQLQEIDQWVKKRPEKPRCGMAISNPKFELWLLLHFENGDGATTPQQCDTMLQGHLNPKNKGSDKNIRFDDFRLLISTAIKNAKKRHQSHMRDCEDYYPCSGVTTVYRLVEEILKHKN